MEVLDYRYECENAMDFCKTLPDNSVKLIITSPPYNIGKEYETRTSIESYINNLKKILIPNPPKELQEKFSEDRKSVV